MFSNKIPVCILSFNRPQYLVKCLNSIIRQQDVDLSRYEFFLFQDNIKSARTNKVYGKQQDVEQCLLIFKNFFRKENVFLSNANIGTARNHYRALKFVFEEYKAYYGIFIEDDIELSPFYFYYNEIFNKQFDTFELGIGCFSGYGKDIIANYQEQYKNRYKICSYGTSTIVTYYFYTWEKIKTIFHLYLSTIDSYDYSDRPKSKIIDFYHTLNVDIEKNYVSSQDRVKEVAMLLNDMIFLGTYVNLAKHIGEEGIHTNKVLFKKLNFDKKILFNQKIDKFQEINKKNIDNYIKKWKKIFYIYTFYENR